MSHTPETDANLEIWLRKTELELGDGKPISGNVVDADFARTLELQRNDARASAETWREQYECAEQDIKNLQHYAQGKEGHVSINSPAISIRDALIGLRQQRDRLVELVKQIAWEAGGLDYDVGFKILDRMDEALAAVKGVDQ